MNNHPKTDVESVHVYEYELVMCFKSIFVWGSCEQVSHNFPQNVF